MLVSWYDTNTLPSSKAITVEPLEGDAFDVDGLFKDSKLPERKLFYNKKKLGPLLKAWRIRAEGCVAAAIAVWENGVLLPQVRVVPVRDTWLKAR